MLDELLPAARTGAAWALERVYRELARPVTAYLRLRGAADPDDVASDVFVHVLTGLPRFEGDGAAFRGWVFTIARRRLFDELRRRGRRVATVPLVDQDAASGDVEAEALAALGGGRVAEVLSTLTADQRDVLLLRVVADLSVEAAAAALGKRPDAVRQLQRRALAALRRQLEREGVTP